MKARLLLPVLLVALSLASAFSQAQEAQITAPLRILNPVPGGPPPGLPQPETPKLTKFSLDFPGGTPQQLVTAIEKAMSKPLNVIIPAKHADFILPPLKMNNVSVSQLFEALGATSRKTETYHPPGTAGWDQRIQTSYGFRTPNLNWVSDDSIWGFYVENPPTPPQAASVTPKVCRYYPLASHLERGLTVDDITTAITTGWEMSGETSPFEPPGLPPPGSHNALLAGTMPIIRFHKETKLLIAVGDPAKLETIDAVLKALSPMPGAMSPAALSAFAERYGIPKAPGGSGGRYSATASQAVARSKDRELTLSPCAPCLVLDAFLNQAGPVADSADAAPPVAALTRALVAGDEAAYRSFHDAYVPRLHRYLLVVTAGDEEAAREALQAALVRVVRHIKIFSDETRFWNWLTVLARTALADQRRKQRRYFAFLDRFTSHAQAEAAPENNGAADTHLLALLEHGLAHLAADERELVERKYFRGQSVREIANELQTTEKAIESRLVRARRKLKDRLLQELKHDPTD